MSESKIIKIVDKENYSSSLTLARAFNKILVRGGPGNERERFYLPYESENI
jgi:hypothetical protein